MISAIILSWNRIDNLIGLLHEYSQYRIVSEIIVFNNNPQHDLKSTIEGINPGIILIQTNKDLGMYTRFAAAGLASNNCILYVDDDIFVPESTVAELHTRWLAAPGQCHGTHGRNAIGGYVPLDRFGQVKIVLTRCLMTSKENCLRAFRLALQFEHLNSFPKGNGEDIILSYSSILSSGSLNKAYELPTTDLPGSKNEESSIHKRWPGHYAHRLTVVHLCEKLLKKNRTTFTQRIWNEMKRPFL